MINKRPSAPVRRSAPQFAGELAPSAPPSTRRETARSAHTRSREVSAPILRTGVLGKISKGCES